MSGAEQDDASLSAGSAAADSDPGTVSLEALAGALHSDASPSSSSAAPSEGSASDADPPTGSAAPADAASAEEDLDSALADEDPDFVGALSEFKASAAELAAAEAAAVAEIAPLESEIESDVAEEPPKGPAGRLSRAAQFVAAWARWAATEGATDLFRFLVRSARAGVEAAARGARSFLALPRRDKSLILALALLPALGAAVVFAYRGGTSAAWFREPYLESMADVADAAFEFDPNDRSEMESFDSPLRAAEHVVALEKVVVNLRREEGLSPNPMGLFEFYVRASSREAAIELADRKGEAREAAQGAIATMAFTEIETAEGKARLKRLVRKSLNDLLTKGRVREVYFKTLILKD